MKKTFTLTHPKIKYARRIDAVRNELKKYISRELRKELPEGFDVWHFDCKFGTTVDEAEVIEIADVSKCIDGIERAELESFYIEILAKAVHKGEGF